MARVRVAGDSDAAAITALLAASRLSIAGLDDAWLTLVAEWEAPSSWAGSSSSIVAVAALERHAVAKADGLAEDPGRRPSFLLRSVAVVPDLRGAGLGQSVVEAALSAADAEVGGTATVGLLTETAAGYFERFGFEPVEHDELPASVERSARVNCSCADGAQAYLRRGEHR